MNITSSTTSKCAFIKYDDDRAVEVGQHLTNTVLIDRAIVCAPFLQSKSHLRFDFLLELATKSKLANSRSTVFCGNYRFL